MAMTARAPKEGSMRMGAGYYEELARMGRGGLIARLGGASPSSLDRPRFALARKPRAPKMPWKRRGEQAIAQRVGLPGHVRVPEACPDEHRVRVRDVVPRELALLHLVGAHHPGAIEPGAEHGVVGFRRASLGEEADELVPAV